MKLSLPIFHLKRIAKQMSRDQGIPLHQALETVAKSEGFRSWGHLAARHSTAFSTTSLLGRLDGAALTLLAARPEQGKTMLSLDILAAAVRAGRSAHFFTLDYNENVARRALGSHNATGVQLDTSDDICAAYIVKKLRDCAPNTLAVIDYLQLLDQKRTHPPLADQIKTLKSFAQRSGVALMFLSQIDRRFEGSGSQMPDVKDIRLPNPLDLNLFDAFCFLHEGTLRLVLPERA